MTNTKFDLHFHSTYSDGRLSVPELAKIISNEELEFCALADHNIVDGVVELVDCLSKYHTKVITATELTAKYMDNEVHILAYDLDVNKSADILRKRNEIVQQKKVAEMEACLKLFKKLGIEVKENLRIEEKQPVSLTVALDICAREDNQKFFIKNFDRRLIPEDIYYEYQAPGKACFVERAGVSVEWLVDMFNGVAKDLIIAHPFVSVSVVTKPLSINDINDLIKKGITGIEVYHDSTSREQIALLVDFVNKHNLHYTGGSDFHGKQNNTPIGKYNATDAIPGFFLSNYKSS